MARYKLLSQHFSEEDKLLEPDTIVGDGTEHKWTRPPTGEMEPLDEAGRRAVERERIRAREHGLPWGPIAPLEDLPLTVGEADAKYEEDVRAGERATGAAAPPPVGAIRRGPGRPRTSRPPELEPDEPPEEEEEFEPEPEPPKVVYRAPTMIDRSKR